MKKVLVSMAALLMVALSGCSSSEPAEPAQDTAQTTAIVTSQEKTEPASAETSSAETAKSAAEITLTLDPNYENATPSTMTVEAGQPVPADKLTVNYRYGYDQTGYFFDAACTESIGDELIPEKDMTIYAGWEEWSADTKERMDAYLEERSLYGKITSYPLAFEKTGFVEYFKLAKQFFGTRFAGFSEDQMPQLEAVKAAREALKPLTDDWDSTVWYIWGDSMPQAADADQYDYYLALDYPGFKPFLVPYLAADQSSVKGNIIVIAGGGFYNRSNLYEGYATAEYFQSQNYNAYVLQRRVAPSEEIDSSLDLQRAIRYLQYNAKTLGIGKTENISACGYSGGGMTITNFVQEFTETSTPDQVYADYQPDEVDKTPAALDAMLILYGAPAGGFQNVESLTLPQTFIACGEEDVARQNCLDFYDQIVDLTRCELYVYADAPHGVGLGETTYGTSTAATQWPTLAMTFLDITYGYQPASY